MRLFIFVLFLILLVLAAGCTTIDVCIDKDGNHIECPRREHPVREFGHGRI